MARRSTWNARRRQACPRVRPMQAKGAPLHCRPFATEMPECGRLALPVGDRREPYTLVHSSWWIGHYRWYVGPSTERYAAAVIRVPCALDAHDGAVTAPSVALCFPKKGCCR